MQDAQAIVKAFIREEHLFPPATPLLVAVSGGVDSMVAMHLLAQLGYPIHVGHCNFQLRGPDSDADEALVRTAAENSRHPFHSISFDTAAYAEEHQLSVQEAARQLRYDWLEELRKQQGLHFTITAHHINDNAETILYNMTKRTGLKGITGIPVKRDKIARPLLCLTRDDISSYAAAHNIDYREDASNKETKYDRNHMRMNVIPQLEHINPKVVDAIDSLGSKMKDAEVLLQERMSQIRSRILIENRN